MTDPTEARAREVLGGFVANWLTGEGRGFQVVWRGKEQRVFFADRDDAYEALFQLRFAAMLAFAKEAIPSASAPVGREAIARVIDPNAWGELGHDSYLRRADEFFAKGRTEPGDRLTDGYRKKAHDMVQPSLAKADAILALLPAAQPADDETQNTITPALGGGGRFRGWSTNDLSAQCLSQAREQLDPEFSQFMTAVAERLAQPAYSAPDRELMADGYKWRSGKRSHTLECATSNAPAEIPGPCDCAAAQPTDQRELRDALEPFARRAEHLDDIPNDEVTASFAIPIREFRAARAALSSGRA